MPMSVATCPATRILAAVITLALGVSRGLAAAGGSVQSPDRNQGLDARIRALIAYVNDQSDSPDIRAGGRHRRLLNGAGHPVARWWCRSALPRALRPADLRDERPVPRPRRSDRRGAGWQRHGVPAAFGPPRGGRGR